MLSVKLDAKICCKHSDSFAIFPLHLPLEIIPLNIARLTSNYFLFLAKWCRRKEELLLDDSEKETRQRLELTIPVWQDKNIPLSQAASLYFLAEKCLILHAQRSQDLSAWHKGCRFYSAAPERQQIDSPSLCALLGAGQG